DQKFKPLYKAKKKYRHEQYEKAIQMYIRLYKDGLSDKLIMRQLKSSFALCEASFYRIIPVKQIKKEIPR
ncbi:MAG: hypothetical protein C0594_05605, partial [Marinilabiliales bacterium]